MMKHYFTRFFAVLLLFFGVGGTLFAQEVISGKVTDQETGAPLPGVSILVKGTQIGTVTGVEGNYQIKASKDNVLVFSYIGMLQQELPVGDNKVINISLEEDATTLSDIVVTTTRQPVRIIETTTAVSVVGQKTIQSIIPEGFSEAIQGTPGVYTSQSQGRFRGGVFIRGFPDGSGNGLVYTGILIDGLPSLATPARPPDFAFGMDMNVERIEVVRGSAATLFGRASAAGVVNVISRVGGEELGGAFRVTNYNANVENRKGFDVKLEGNLNGPISDNIRFNLGGFYVNDRGFRDLGYNDRGGQIRGNIDFLMKDKGSIRLYGGYTNMTIQNMIDIPYRADDNEPVEGWETYDSFYDEVYDTYTHPFLNNALGIPDANIRVTNPDGTSQDRSLQAANEDGNYARGFNVGLNVEYKLTDWLIFSNKLRYQNYDHGTKFNLGVSSFHFPDPNMPSELINLRILIDGDGNDTDVIDELRFTVPIEGDNVDHSLSLGAYLSRGWYTPETYSWLHVANSGADQRNLGFFAPLLGPDGSPVELPDGSNISVPTTVGGFPVPFGSPARRDEYLITVNSFFFGDEIKAGDKWTINAGARFDRVNMELQGFYNNPADPSSPPDIGLREEEHSDFSFSLGVNHLFNQRSSIYANFVRAFRMPDYGAYSPVDPNSLVDNPTIDDNEIVYNTEVGYRSGFGDLGLDAAVFYTNIQNRLATVYEGAIAVIRPLGTNNIGGGELALTYAPSGVKGLLLRSSFTYQKATFQEFKIPLATADPEGNGFGNEFILEGTDANGDPVFSIDLQGNQVPRIPSTIYYRNLPLH